jgi:hypothetical protein
LHQSSYYFLLLLLLYIYMYISFPLPFGIFHVFSPFKSENPTLMRACVELKGYLFILLSYYLDYQALHKFEENVWFTNFLLHFLILSATNWTF